MVTVLHTQTTKAATGTVSAWTSVAFLLFLLLIFPRMCYIPSVTQVAEILLGIQALIIANDCISSKAPQKSFGLNGCSRNINYWSKEYIVEFVQVKMQEQVQMWIEPLCMSQCQSFVWISLDSNCQIIQSQQRL